MNTDVDVDVGATKSDGAVRGAGRRGRGDDDPRLQSPTLPLSHSSSSEEAPSIVGDEGGPPQRRGDGGDSAANSAPGAPATTARRRGRSVQHRAGALLLLLLIVVLAVALTLGRGGGGSVEDSTNVVGDGEASSSEDVAVLDDEDEDRGGPAESPRVDEGGCPRNAAMFSVEYDSHPSSPSGGTLHAWTLRDACSGEAAAECPPRGDDEGPRPPAFVAVDRSIDRNEVVDPFEAREGEDDGDRKPRRARTTKCVPSDKNYVLEVRPVVAGGAESESCRGLSDPFDAAFVATLDGVVAASASRDEDGGAALAAGGGGSVLRGEDGWASWSIRLGGAPAGEDCEDAASTPGAGHPWEGTAQRPAAGDASEGPTSGPSSGAVPSTTSPAAPSPSGPFEAEGGDAHEGPSRGPSRPTTSPALGSPSNSPAEPTSRPAPAGNNLFDSPKSSNTTSPTPRPSTSPTRAPSGAPTEEPATREPTDEPTRAPSGSPTAEPATREPADEPTRSPAGTPTAKPARAPTPPPTNEPTRMPAREPTEEPTRLPTKKPTAEPTQEPTDKPTRPPTTRPTAKPTQKAIDCPRAGGSADLTSGAEFAFARSSAGAFCGIFVRRGGEGGALVPFARSYDGGEWEASPGPLAGPSDGIACAEGGSRCVVRLPAPADAAADDGYVILARDGATGDRERIARFLETTTFGPRRDEIDALDDGSWGPESRAGHVRRQMDAEASSHREYYRRRANARWDTPTTAARSDHPCSPNSLWRRYAFVPQDANAKDGSYAVVAFEEVAEEAGSVAALYEADGRSDGAVVNCGKCDFGDGSDSLARGYSGAGFYKFRKGDFIEWRVRAEREGTVPVSFRYAVGGAERNGRRPLGLYVNDRLVAESYDFGHTGGWSDWVYSDGVEVSFDSGWNTIRLASGREMGPRIDHLRVGKPPAVAIKTDGWVRTIARDGVGDRNDWGFELSDGVVFPKHPQPPRGYVHRARYGTTTVMVPPAKKKRELDIGNPPVFFTGYEQYLPDVYFAQDALADAVFDDTASQLYDFPLQAGQELLLRNGLTDPICSRIPPFADENDAPVFGQLPNGDWIQWTPTILLETNGPSINTAPADMPKNTLRDGGGSTEAQSEGLVGCANAPRSFVNEDTCFLSLENSVCAPTKSKLEAKIRMTPSNIIAINDIERRYVYAVRGLVLERKRQHPCRRRRSRWIVEPGACDGPTRLGANTASALREAIEGASDDNEYVRDVSHRDGLACDEEDVTTDTLHLRVQVGRDCYAHVHPRHLDVYDFTDWAERHPGGGYNIRKWSEGYLDYPRDGDGGMGVPEHPMDFWEANAAHVKYVARLGDSVSYVDLPDELKSSSLGKYFGSEQAAPGGGTVVCGSIGEVGNDPALNGVFDVVADNKELTTSSTEVLKNHKQVVWTELALYAKDQLRQRMAWALAQIITTVPSDIAKSHTTEKFTQFYDILVRHAFGNYRDILREISYSPIMAEQLSYLGSKSHAYVYSRKNSVISRPDENYAREVMQLFSIGLIKLNDDGTPKLDPETGKPLQTYTNEDIESFARAWTGFDKSPARGNVEETNRARSGLDPMQIIEDWRDPFPKSNLDGGFIGDRYALCQDLSAQAFLKKGARYRLLGGNSSPEWMKDPSGFLGDGPANSILRAELDRSSQLYQRLYNGGDYELTIELENDLACVAIECEVDTLRVVKVGTVYYEYVQIPCVQLGFYDNGKKIQMKGNGKKGWRLCANPDLAHAREACCDRVERASAAITETGVTYLYEGERMTFSTATNRCDAYGGDLCDYESVSVRPSDDDFRKGYHWTNRDCAINVKVNPEGYVAIAHDAGPSNDSIVPHHVENYNTLNWFRVFWDGNGDYPGSSVENSCAKNECQTGSDGSCICQTKVVESIVFDDIESVSKVDVMSKLFIGALGPLSDSIPTARDGFTAHIQGDKVDEGTIFEVEDQGRTFFLKNVRSTVSLGMGSETQPQIFEAEDATVADASVFRKFVQLDADLSSIEWNANVKNSGNYLISFRYSLNARPAPLSIFINGVEVKRQPKNSLIHVVNKSGSPSSEHLPLQRCEGDCDDDGECADGLFCIDTNSERKEVPGCRMDNARPQWDYCADTGDHTHGAQLASTGSWVGDWLYSEPIEVTLVAGTNEVLAQIPLGYDAVPIIDHLKIEAHAPSFRNPPHFLSLIADDNNSFGAGEQTLRDAQYETEAVLDHYLYHPNLAPFLCNRIMQRFSFSNPSPRFVASCVMAFRTGLYVSGSETFGNGEYGNLEAMTAAIILDKEATDPSLLNDPSHGALREPIMKVIALMRSMEYETKIPDAIDGPPMSEGFQVRLWEMDEKIGQSPYEFPSIFSFMLPSYKSDSGPALSASMASPEAMLLSMASILQSLSGMWSLIKYGLTDCEGGFSTDPGFSQCEDNGRYERSYGRLTYQADGTTIAEEAADLALLLTAGRLSDSNRALVVDACTTQPNKESRARCMQQLIVATGEFASTNKVIPSGEDRNDIEIEAAVEDSSEPYKAVVYLYLAGGLDSFNMLVPYTCSPIDVHERYRLIRGMTDSEDGVGLPLSRLLEIPSNNPNQPCTSFGIHEELPVLKQLYEQTIFVANAGLLAQPVSTRDFRDLTNVQLFSHNDMSMETSRDDIADKYAGTGVGGRIADALTKAGIQTNVFSIKGQQTFLVGEPGGSSPSQVTINRKGLSSFNDDPTINDMTNVIKALNSATTSDSGFFAETYAFKLSDAIAKYQSLKLELDKAKPSVDFPMSGIADQLKMVTRLMQTAPIRGAKRDIFYVSDSGYDTHKNVEYRLRNNFSRINAAIEAFVEELKVLNLWESTVLLQFSEFGRTLTPNTGDGTDHGWGGNHFMLGGSVKGGTVLGQYPEDFEQSSTNDIALSRGRIIPTHPWDAMWKGAAEWFGVSSDDMDKVLPMHKQFPPELLYGERDLFVTNQQNKRQEKEGTDEASASVETVSVACSLLALIAPFVSC